jgi:general secretion pathway protein F
MPMFRYEASDREGKILTGDMEARTSVAVIDHLRQLDLFPVRVTEEGGGDGRSISTVDVGEFVSRFRGKTRIVLPFTIQLATMLDSGVPLDRALTVMLEIIQDDAFREAVRRIRSNVQAGKSLTDAMKEYPRYFSPLYVSVVAAGEFGGFLEVAFRRLADYLEEDQRLKGQVKSAMIYPLLLTIVGGAAVLILLTFVLPRFTGIFEDLGQSLPLSTAILLSFSQFLSTYWWLGLLFLVLSILGARAYIGTEEGGRRWDTWKITLPLIGELNKKIAVSRFSRTLGTLIDSGVPILQALLVAKETFQNRIFAGAIQDVHDSLKEGESIAPPLRERAVFPPMATHMIAVGEETGRLSPMLLKVADAFENEAGEAIKNLISLIEPVMILLFGAVVGFVVLSLLMAITSLNELPF